LKKPCIREDHKVENVKVFMKLNQVATMNTWLFIILMFCVAWWWTIMTSLLWGLGDKFKATQLETWQWIVIIRIKSMSCHVWEIKKFIVLCKITLW
jgi:hypothetical protein